MSLKENVEYVKEELNSQEKFLEGSIKLERFYKKYKILIIGLSSIVIIAIGAYLVDDYIKQDNKQKANEAYNTLLKNPSDASSLKILKDKNLQLFEIAEYLNSKKEGEIKTLSIDYLKDLSFYEQAIKNDDISELNRLSMDSNFILREYVILNKAIIEIKNGKYSNAKESLALIPATSKLQNLVVVLNHYLITK